MIWLPGVLSQGGNVYTWKRYSLTRSVQRKQVSNPETFIVHTEGILYAADSYTFDAETGKFKLSNINSYYAYSSLQTIMNQRTEIYSDDIVNDAKAGTYDRIYGRTITSRTLSGQYYMYTQTVYELSAAYGKGTYIDEVKSTSLAAYPENGEQGGYWYVLSVGGSSAVNYVDYIEGTGTQFIKTDFTPNQDTRVVADFQSTVSTGGWPIFGSRYSGSDRAYTFGSTSTNNCWLSGYNASSVNSNVTENANRHTVDKNKNVCYLDGTVIATGTYGSFTCPGPMWIFRFYAGNGDNAAIAKLRLYSLKIYNNDVLVHDFRPCLDPDGAACLYDEVNTEYVYNAGSGTFAYGMAA